MKDAFGTFLRTLRQNLSGLPDDVITSVTKLRPAPGDLLVLRMGRRVASEERERLVASLRRLVPDESVRIAVCDIDADIELVKRGVQ